MKTLLLSLATTTALVFATPTMAFNTPDIDIGYTRGATVITVYSNDDVIVEKVVGNNGSCEVTIGQRKRDLIQGLPKKRLPLNILKGSKWTFYSRDSTCTLRDITLVTRKGDFEYTVY